MTRVTPKNVIMLELNEVNFTYVARYIERGCLPALRTLLERHGVTETSSESSYEQLEPWIQWVTAHTGLDYGQHGVFRLGDIVHTDLKQIWEVLEQRGVSVGAVSPMNAKNRCRAARFFVPDPWTPTEVTGGRLIKNLHRALKQAVSDNAQSRVTAFSAFWLLAGFLRFSRLRSLPTQLRCLVSARGRPWSRAIFLDRLLADVFMSSWRSGQPQFCTLFLNAAAHIQHHYLFCSAVYDGPQRNPNWYAKPDSDPVFEVYRLYDQIVAEILEMCSGCRLIIATGLTQDPCSTPMYYYRLRDHKTALLKLGVEFDSVVPLMSRDFLLHCGSRSASAAAARRLHTIVAADGTSLFTAEPRDTTVFAMLTYPNKIAAPFNVHDTQGQSWDISNDVAFVALKNGIHNGTGYLIDTADHRLETPRHIPLSSLFGRICEAF
jgi:hypothetical protein